MGKRLFTVALACCLLLVCFLSWNDARRSDAWASQQTLENNTLTIAMNDDGMVTIEGEGALTSGDLNTLMNGQRIAVTQVNDIVLGDGITEVGYNAINGYSYLQTLKLGAGIQVVNNGAIKGCTALEYVYIPKGIRRLGRDFLYRSDSAVVVTDGEAGDLPKMKNVPSERVLALVDSYETLLERRAAMQTAEDQAEAPQVPDTCRAWWN